RVVRTCHAFAAGIGETREVPDQVVVVAHRRAGTISRGLQSLQRVVGVGGHARAVAHAGALPIGIVAEGDRWGGAVAVAGTDQLIDRVVGVARQLASRVVQGDAVAGAVVGVGGGTAQRIGDRGQPVEWVVGVVGRIAQAISLYGLVAVDVVGVLEE